jgi:hypothetical protein
MLKAYEEVEDEELGKQLRFHMKEMEIIAGVLFRRGYNPDIYMCWSLGTGRFPFRAGAFRTRTKIEHKRV